MPVALPAFSIPIFATLVVIFLASTAVFYALVRRMTDHRQRIELKEWATEHRAHLRTMAIDELPPPLASLQPTIELSLRGPREDLVRLTIDARTWNVLVRRIQSDWIPSGLRPATHESSVFDLLELSVYPAYSTAERFHLISADNAAARKLSKSSVRALIPADLGLLLWGQWMVLDFTQRPFDPIEFGRVMALAEQVEKALP